MDLSKEDMAGLTADEIEALTGEGAEEALNTVGGGDEDDGGAAAGAVEAAAAAAAEDKGATDPAADPAKAAAAEAAGKTGDEAALDADALAQVADDSNRQFVPKFATGNADKEAETLAALTKEKGEAFQKLMEGELTPAQYQELEERVAAQREAVTIARALSHADRVSTEQRETDVLQRLAAAAKKTGDVDYGQPKVAARFDAEMSLLKADPDWQGKDFSELAAEAHKNVLMLMGKAPAPKTAAAAAAPPAAPAVGPRTLSGLPNAALANTGGNPVMEKFSTLQGEDAEAYLASLPQAEVDRLLRATA